MVVEIYWSGLTPNSSAINLGVIWADDLYVVGILKFGSLSNLAIALSTLSNSNCLDKTFLETFSILGVVLVSTSPVVSLVAAICGAVSLSILVVLNLFSSRPAFL